MVLSCLNILFCDNPKGPAEKSMLWRSLKSMAANHKLMAENLVSHSTGFKLTELKAKLLADYITDPAFKPEIIRKVCPGAAKVCDWIKKKVGDEVLAYRIIEYRRNAANKSALKEEPQSHIAFTEEEEQIFAQSAKRQFLKADISGDGKLSYEEFQRWFNSEYRKDLEDEASKYAQTYENNVGSIEKELKARDKVVHELQGELQRLKSQLELKGLVSSRVPPAEGWLAGKDTPLIQVTRSNKHVLNEGEIKSLDNIYRAVFEIESNDFSLITQTPMTLRMGPVIRIIISHKDIAEYTFTLTLTPLVAMRICGANNRSLIDMKPEVSQPLFDKILENLEIILVNNPLNFNKRELFVRFCVYDILYKVSYISVGMENLCSLSFKYHISYREFVKWKI